MEYLSLDDTRPRIFRWYSSRLLSRRAIPYQVVAGLTVLILAGCNSSQSTPLPQTALATGVDSSLETRGEESSADKDSDEQHAARLRIDKAKWNREDKKLTVKGRGPRGVRIVLEDADQGTRLAARTSKDLEWTFKIKGLDATPCRVRVTTTGQSVERAVRNAPESCSDGGDDDGGDHNGNNGNGNGNGGSGNGGLTGSGFRVLAVNDLGMHCADRDYQIFSILPPFNVVHAQVIATGRKPSILSNQAVDVHYQATANRLDPVSPGSINTSSQNRPGIFKSNFWETRNGKSLGGLAYGALYPPGVFDNFEPLPADKGIPVPDAAVLPALAAGQQSMPGFTNPFRGNAPQRFGRFDRDLHFFASFPFGKVIQGVDWFAADGIPLSPVDDNGVVNAYPMMKVSASDKPAGKTLASTDIVLPVASEADCQNCHADPVDAGNGIAATFASTPFDVLRAVDAPAPEKLLNAAKINILRLHDAKHGSRYTSSIDGKPAICDPRRDPADPDCLANQTPVQCSQCHYSPALDLAQVGPIDDTGQGIKGRQQTRHISMSRAMHAFHGRQKGVDGKPLFPPMPTPDSAARSGGAGVNSFEQEILDQTCYQCHPGKNTQCLRGAMFNAGVVCQDCHGGMEQVGNDFSGQLASGGGLDLSRRIPWASEPKCQSCHTGDALQLNSPSGAIVSADGIRLLQAYVRGDTSATPIESPASRFAENQSLFRLSGNDDGSGKGHHGILCEGCHGSTHAIWPNPNPNANDNIAASQLQGHSGPIVECDTCHESGSLGITLGGPHGMHPVGGGRFADGGHEDLAEHNANSCRACHGRQGQGTVLSVVKATRNFVIKECEGGSLCPGGERKNVSVTLSKGQQVGCSLCHENKL